MDNASVEGSIVRRPARLTPFGVAAAGLLALVLFHGAHAPPAAPPSVQVTPPPAAPGADEFAHTLKSASSAIQRSFPRLKLDWKPVANAVSGKQIVTTQVGPHGSLAVDYGADGYLRRIAFVTDAAVDPRAEALLIADAAAPETDDLARQPVLDALVVALQGRSDDLFYLGHAQIAVHQLGHGAHRIIATPMA